MCYSDDGSEESQDEFDAFLAAIDRALTEQLGPDHQRILSERGRTYDEFVW